MVSLSARVLIVALGTGTYLPAAAPASPSVPQRGSPRRLSTLSCAAGECRRVSWAAVPRGGHGSLCSPVRCHYLKPEHCWPDQGFYVSGRDLWPEQMCRQCGSLLFRSLAESVWIPVGHARRRGCVQAAWLQLTSWRDRYYFPLSGSGSHMITELNCAGSESYLWYCPYKEKYSVCYHGDTSLICSGGVFSFWWHFPEENPPGVYVRLGKAGQPLLCALQGSSGSPMQGPMFQREHRGCSFRLCSGDLRFGRRLARRAGCEEGVGFEPGHPPHGSLCSSPWVYSMFSEGSECLMPSGFLLFQTRD